MPFFIDLVDGKLGIQQQRMPDLQAGYITLLTAFYFSGSSIELIDLHAIKWDSVTKKIDMSGKVNGNDVMVALLAIYANTSQIGVFGDGYANLVFTKTSSVASVSGKSLFADKKANANGIIPFEGVVEVKNLNLDIIKSSLKK